jgi:DNA topoisomerase-1
MKYIQTYQLFEKVTTYQKTPDKVIKKRWEKKRNAIKNLQDNISKLRKKVSIDMDSEDEKTMIIATIVRIIDKTGERVGNEDSRDNGHHGISNLMKKHIKVNGSDVTLNYTGKSGVKHNVTFNDSKVARNVNKIMKNGEVFITSDGLNVKSIQVNNYLEQFDITSKDLRGFKVNQLMSEKLRKMKKPETDGEIKRMFNDALREVAEKIGHTPGICRKNYLLPEIEEAWYSGKEVQKV